MKIATNNYVSTKHLKEVSLIKQCLKTFNTFTGIAKCNKD